MKMKEEPNYIKWLAIGVIMIAILFLRHDINQVKKSVAPAPVVIPESVVIREKYFRGDIIRLGNGSEAWISDKSLSGSKEWNYEVHAFGVQKQWVPESAIQAVVKESPTRPKAEK